jgi:hypothetical protein
MCLLAPHGVRRSMPVNDGGAHYAMDDMRNPIRGGGMAGSFVIVVGTGGLPSENPCGRISHQRRDSAEGAQGDGPPCGH